MKIVAISDTHNRHREIALPQGDVLIHAGDFTSMGREAEIADFGRWLNDQPFQHKIVVPGNHDLMFDYQFERAQALLPPDVILMGGHPDYTYDIDGVVFAANSFTPEFGDWAFQHTAKEAQAYYARMPRKVDVLITHGPPKGVLDLCPGGSVGCPALNRHVFSTKPKHHIFGHIHESYGNCTVLGVAFHNVSMLDGRYATTNRRPLEIEI